MVIMPDGTILTLLILSMMMVLPLLDLLFTFNIALPSRCGVADVLPAHALSLLRFHSILRVVASDSFNHIDFDGEHTGAAAWKLSAADHFSLVG